MHALVLWCGGSERHSIECSECHAIIVSCGCSEAVGKDGYWCKCAPSNPDQIGTLEWWGNDHA